MHMHKLTSKTALYPMTELSVKLRLSCSQRHHIHLCDVLSVAEMTLELSWVPHPFSVDLSFLIRVRQTPTISDSFCFNRNAFITYVAISNIGFSLSCLGLSVGGEQCVPASDLNEDQRRMTMKTGWWHSAHRILRLYLRCHVCIWHTFRLKATQWEFRYKLT